MAWMDYRIYRRFTTLIHKPPPPDVVEQIQEYSLLYPTLGVNQLSHLMKLQGIYVSGTTILKILIRKGIGRQWDRVLKLEAKALDDEIDLTPLQKEGIEKANPCFKERHTKSNRPGELLCQATLFVGHTTSEKIYMQTVVDTFSCYAFASLHPVRLPQHAAALVFHQVIPKFNEWGITIDTIETGNGSEFGGRSSHLFPSLLNYYSIQQRRIHEGSGKFHGFIQRFQMTVFKEFFRPLGQRNFSITLHDLHQKLQDWLQIYNQQNSYPGYPNRGKSPLAMIENYLLNIGRNL